MLCYCCFRLLLSLGRLQMANAWGLLVPIVGQASTARFGSYMPLFLQSVVANVIGAILFAKYARLTSPLEDERATT